jgi:tripartite-type tricarboxylate transporter receptor subunit TctC
MVTGKIAGRTNRFVLAALALTLAACASSSEHYPSREVKLIVQASPGGISDTVSRVIASLAETKLGVPIVCENKPGASGALAFSYVTRQPPDGYIIGHAPVEIAMVRTLGYAEVGPQNMDLLCLVSKTPPALAVQAQSRWKTFDDFVKAARARPEYYVVANSGTGSIWHINALLMERSAGLRLIHCPFAGSSGSLTALLGGHVDAAVAGAGEVVPQVKAGRLRVLAVFDQSRSELFPDVPSVYELGYHFGVSAWSGFYGPKGLPAQVRHTLADAIRTAFESREFQTLCEERGMEPLFLDNQEFRTFAFQQAHFFESTIPKLLSGLQ